MSRRPSPSADRAATTIVVPADPASARRPMAADERMRLRALLAAIATPPSVRDDGVNLTKLWASAASDLLRHHPERAATVCDHLEAARYFAWPIREDALAFAADLSAAMPGTAGPFCMSLMAGTSHGLFDAPPDLRRLLAACVLVAGGSTDPWPALTAWRNAEEAVPMEERRDGHRRFGLALSGWATSCGADAMACFLRGSGLSSDGVVGLVIASGVEPPLGMLAAMSAMDRAP